MVAAHGPRQLAPDGAGLIAELARQPPAALPATPEGELMGLARDPLAIRALLSRKPPPPPPDGVEAKGRRRIAAVPLAAARWGDGASAAPRRPVLRKLAATAPARQSAPRPEPVATPFMPSTADRRAAIDGWALRDPAGPALPLLLLALTGFTATALAFWVLI